MAKELKNLPSPKRTIRLEIDLDAVPLDVEYGISHLENCIIDELRSELRTTSEIKERTELLRSIENSGRQKNYFLYKTTQPTPKILGLWAWDLVNSEGKTLTESLDHLSVIVNEGEGEEYDIDAIKPQYQEIAKAIRGAENTRSEKTMDSVITLSPSIKIGERKIG